MKKTPSRSLPVFCCILAATLVAHAQFYYITNDNNTITITGYTGAGGGTLVIPDTTNGLPVTAIGNGAFYSSSLTYRYTIVVTGSNLTSIGNNAFYGCSRLTDITIGAGVTTIGTQAFEECTNLTRVVLNNSPASIGDEAFYNCSGLTNISLGNAATSIGVTAFRRSKLKSLVIPDSMTSIGASAFQECADLNTATLGQGLTNIAGGMFCYDGRLTNIIINGTNVTSIDNYAFASCGFASIAIPSSVTRIGDFAFCGCGLADLTLCNQGSIGDHTFASCPNLTKVNIGGGITNVGPQAFSECPRLASLTLGGSVACIDLEAFEYCSELTNVVLCEGVKSIGGYAFSVCEKLGPITIPASVTNIGNGAFQVCYRLQALYFEGDAPYFGEFLFQAADNETLYYLPGKQGWEVPSVRYPSSLWRPEMVPVKINTRPETNQFGFYIHWARGMNVTIETCTNLTAPAWVPLQTNTLSSSLDYFTDAGGQTLPGRFYRLRWPESTQ